jgi:hypothetical protein
MTAERDLARTFRPSRRKSWAPSLAPTIAGLQVDSGRSRMIVQDSPVPTLDLRPSGGVLYPTRYGMTVCEEVIVTVDG